MNEWRFSFVALSQIHCELVIKPSQSLLTRDQHRSFIALCTDKSDDRIINWRSPQQKDVPENTNDRYEIWFETMKRTMH